MKRILSLLISLIMVLSCMTVSYAVSAQSEFSKTVIDFDTKNSSNVAADNGSYEIVDYTTIDETYTYGNVLKASVPNGYKAVKIALPKSWKEGNPIALRFTVIGDTDVGINRNGTGICKQSGYDWPMEAKMAQMGMADTDFKVAAGESYTFEYDLSLVDISEFEYASYIVIGTSSAASMYVDNVELVYADENSIPDEHDRKVVIEDFENGLDNVTAKNESGNSSFGGSATLVTDAYEGTNALKAGKKCWDNNTSAGYMTHYAANYVSVALDTEKVKDAYDIIMYYKGTNAQFGVTVDGKNYWETTGYTSSEYKERSSLYTFYTYFAKDESGALVQYKDQGITLTPENISKVSAILISASNNVSQAYGIVDNISVIDGCSHSNHTVLTSADATCEIGAYKEIKCNDCGKVIKIFDEAHPALGHNWVVEKVVEPTSNAGGYTLYKCLNCNLTKQDDFTYLQASNHRFIAATNQIPDDVENTKYFTLYNTLPTSEAKYTTKADVDANIPYVTDATYSAAVGTFYDATAGHCVTFGRNSSNVGDYIQFTFELDAGIYNFYTYSRSHNGRGTYSVLASANGESSVLTNSYKQNTGGDTGSILAKNDLGYLVVPEKTAIDFKFTCVSAGAMFFKALIFDSCSEVPDGVTPTYIAAAKVDASVNATMESGAEIRLSKVNGIRFLTKFDSAKIAELQAQGATVELGTLIAPKDLIGSEELNFDLDTSKYVVVPYNAVKDGSFEWHKGVDGQIAGSIVRILESDTAYDSVNGNIARDFVGRGYVKVTIDGETTISYADYANGDIANNSRSLAYVANALKNDIAIFPDLSDLQKELVNKWASKLS